MLAVTCALLFPLVCGVLNAAPADTLRVMCWNVENFFNYDGESGNDFRAGGVKRWTAGRFYTKCNSIAKTVNWIGERHGGLPDVIGLAEIEDATVLKRLIYTTVLRKSGYSFVHYDSPDHRGIDVALLWRRDKFDMVSSKPCHIEGIATRDILLTQLRRKGSQEEIAFMVVHLPSKFGGEESVWKRDSAAARLYSVADSVYREGVREIVVMGDFNDVPDAVEFKRLRPLLFNMADPLYARREGTIRYNGNWELIDMFWVTEELRRRSEMSIVKVPFLMTRDNVMGGEKPLRTYLGPRYIGGVSDHCPIYLEVLLETG